MNEVRLRGRLDAIPVIRMKREDEEAPIWLNVDEQWIAVLCRGLAAQDACQCQPGAEVEVTGFIESVQTSPDTWSLRVVATNLVVCNPANWLGSSEQSQDPYIYLNSDDESGDWDGESEDWGDENGDSDDENGDVTCPTYGYRVDPADRDGSWYADGSGPDPEFYDPDA